MWKRLAPARVLLSLAFTGAGLPPEADVRPAKIVEVPGYSEGVRGLKLVNGE